jgi:hypothetical protein
MPTFQVLPSGIRAISFPDFISELSEYEFGSSLEALAHISWAASEKDPKGFIKDASLLAQVARGLLLSQSFPNNVNSKIQPDQEAFVRWKEKIVAVAEHPADAQDQHHDEKVFVATSYEQFPFQDGSSQDAIRRFYRLLCSPTTEKMINLDWSTHLGVSLDTNFYVWISFWAFFRANNGVTSDLIQFGDAAMEANLASIGITISSISKSIDIIAENPSKFVDLEEGSKQGWELRRYDPNPLLSKPIVRVSGGRICCPVPSAYENAVGSGLYYTGVAIWGNSFANILGAEFEAYIGEQFQLLGVARVHQVPRKDHGPKRCDWIVIFDSFALLVEVKVQRLNASARAGGVDFEKEIEKVISEPLKQINATAQDVSSGQADFDYIPQGFALRGMVVTLEPFFLANTVGKKVALEKESIPTLFVSSKELEELVSCTLLSEAEALIINCQDDPKNAGMPMWEVMNRVDYPSTTNPIVNQALDRAPWSNF